ncbi:carboxyl transferase domain protein [Mycobacterium kansasii]|uniref:Carboxyl transferase domain protein n=1 Tax=Mycobacterium kansasii TaxID=1768 RepID=A0A1V3XJJ8_MYCKA|nr:carboxyl transferase domain protein [Mycobacterium kansasii]
MDVAKNPAGQPDRVPEPASGDLFGGIRRADLPTQKEIFIPGGAMFRDLTRLSAAGIPTIALVFGNSTAGGAYIPGMCDHVVMIKERSKVFLAGRHW